MDGRPQRTSASNLPYAERLARYEADKASIPRVKGDYKTYEQAVKMLAKKWRI